MVAASLQQVKAEIAARASAINGLRCYEEVPANPQVPCLGVRGPLRWTYGTTFDGDWVITLAVDIFVNPTDLPRAQQALDAYISPSGSKSVPSMLEDTVVTTGIIQSVNVQGGNAPYAFYGDENRPRLLVATIEVDVVPSIE